MRESLRIKYKRLRILLYSLNFAPEPVGIGKFSGEMAAWLIGRGHEVRVISAPPYFPHWQVGLPGDPGTCRYRNRYRSESMEGIRIVRCPLWVPRQPSGPKRLLHLASFALSSLPAVLGQRRWKPDLVFTVAPAFFCAPAALLLQRLCGQPTLSWLHVQDFELDVAYELGMLRGRWVRRLAENWERSVLRGFDRVSSISNAMVQKLWQKGVASERTTLLPNWVDLDAIRPQDATERAGNPYRRELGIAPEQKVLLYSGSMNRKQGLELLAQVILRLKHRRDLVWLLAGEGPTKGELAQACAGLEQVRLMPLQPIDRLNDWLNLADIHLLPQKANAADLVLPSKLLGMLASGRPVVAGSPEGSELATLVEQAGICVAPEDAASFAAAVQRLADDPRLWSAKGQQARTLAERCFGRDAVMSNFEREAERMRNEFFYSCT